MILFIDDDIRGMQTFVKDLTDSGHDAHQELTVDDGLNFLHQNSAQIEALVLDIMMDGGETFTNEDIQDGLRTGVILFDKIRDEYPDLPIVILTNVTAEPVEMTFAGRPHCLFLPKQNWYAFELVDQINAMLPNERTGELR